MSKEFKDHFSGHADQYHIHRPGYPGQLFQYLSGLTAEHDCAWDCATGNGQAAIGLSNHFAKVIATDGSQKQIDSAVQKPGIEYRTALAEASGIDSQSVNLITVAQAIHWFDLGKFLSEVVRVLKPDGVLAIWTYGLTRIRPDIDEVVRRLYGEVLDPYWPPERKLVENEYREIIFPLPELSIPRYEMNQQWTLMQLMGYLNTWSAVQRYQQHQGQNPVEQLFPEFRRLWGEADTVMQVSWPLVSKAWRNNPPE